MNAAHVARVSALTRWGLSGKLGIRQPDAGASLGIVWDQDGNDYLVRVRGPLGQSAALVRGDERRVVVERAGESPLVGDDAGALVREALGWDIPVNALKFWIRGLPDPGLEVQSATYLEGGWFGELAQRDWHVELSRYREVDGLTLPGRIRARRDHVTLTLVVTRWRTLDGEGASGGADLTP